MTKALTKTGEGKGLALVARAKDYIADSVADKHCFELARLDMTAYRPFANTQVLRRLSCRH